MPTFAFFDYDEEIASQCIENYREDSIFAGSPVIDPNLIRIRVSNMSYVFAKATAAGLLRTRLPSHVYHSMRVITDPDARDLFVDECYEDIKPSEDKTDSQSGAVPRDFKPKTNWF